MEKQSHDIMKNSVANYNITLTFAVRYALGRATSAPITMRVIISDSMDILCEQTKRGIISDIEDFLAQNILVPCRATWEDLLLDLKKDIQRRKTDG